MTLQYMFRYKIHKDHENNPKTLVKQNKIEKKSESQVFVNTYAKLQNQGFEGLPARRGDPLQKIMEATMTEVYIFM